MCPDVSLFVSAIAGEYPPGEMMVAPEASFAVTVTGIEIALPAYGIVLAREIVTEATTPSSVIGTLVGALAIVALTLPVASLEPVAFVPE